MGNNALMLVTDSEAAWECYKRALLCGCSRRLDEALFNFQDAFLLRARDGHCPDPMWVDFFRIQFTIYLLGKKRMWCSLSEGDMILDLLKDAYLDLKRRVTESDIPYKGDIRELFISEKIDFPWGVGEDDPFQPF